MNHLRRLWHFLVDWPEGDEIPAGVVLALFAVLVAMALFGR